MKRYISILLIILALGIVGSVCGATYINSLPYTINESGYYILNTSCTDLDDTAITINADNVVLDGNGMVLDGNNTGWGDGIYVENHKNITIKNLTVREFWCGIWLDESSNNTITNVNVLNNHIDGIHLEGSSYNTITNVNASYNGYNGICLKYSFNNIITNINVLNHEDDGIRLKESFNNMIANVNAVNNGGGICLIHSSNNIITDVNASNNGEGIRLGGSFNNTVTNVNALNNYDGIYLTCSYYNTIIDCNILDCEWSGIHLDYSSNNIITDVNASNNYAGIYLYNSSNNMIANVNALNNDNGVYLYYSSSYNIITNVNALNNGYGIFLDGSSNNNIVCLNNFINNSKSVYIYSSVGNIFHSPILINYTYNGKTYTNYLGNYYSDYTGTDSDGDGIGDTAYIIDSFNSDLYPLIKPVENYIINTPTPINETTLFGIILPNATIGVNKTTTLPIILNTTEPLGSLQFRIYYNPDVINITKVESSAGMIQANIGYGFVEVGIINASGFNSGEIAKITVVGLSNGTTILDGELIDASDVEGNKKYGLVIPGEVKVITRKKGDANGDDKITAVDALIYLRFAVGLDITPYKLDPVADDMTGDGKITATDALKVLRIAVGLE